MKNSLASIKRVELNRLGVMNTFSWKEQTRNRCDNLGVFFRSLKNIANQNSLRYNLIWIIRLLLNMKLDGKNVIVIHVYVKKETFSKAKIAVSCSLSSHSSCLDFCLFYVYPSPQLMLSQYVKLCYVMVTLCVSLAARILLAAWHHKNFSSL